MVAIPVLMPIQAFFNVIFNITPLGSLLGITQAEQANAVWAQQTVLGASQLAQG